MLRYVTCSLLNPSIYCIFQLLLTLCFHRVSLWASVQQSSQEHINESAVMASNTNENILRLINPSEQSYGQDGLTLFLRYLKTHVQQYMSKEDQQQKVPIEDDIYCCNHEFLPIGREVLMEVINHTWVSASVISLYIRFLYHSIMTQEQKDRFVFLDPHQLAVYDELEDKLDDKSQYMSDVFKKKAKHGTLFLAPYNSKKHWVLLAINPLEEIVYYLDSCHGDPSNYPELKKFVNNALAMFCSSREATQPENKQSEWTRINVPKQPNNEDCGYYVMRFMREVTAINSNKIPVDYFPEFKCTTYSQNKLQQIKEEWAQHVFEILTFPGTKVLPHQVSHSKVGKAEDNYLEFEGSSGGTGPKIPSMTLDERFKHLEETRVKLEENYKISKSKIQTVPSYIRERENYDKYYSPKLISFGPIHHGDPKLKRGEQYKLMWASMYAKAHSLTLQYLYNRIAKEIDKLRELFSWDELRHAQNYSNDDLAWMLLVDGCSVLQILEKPNHSKSEEYLKVKVDILFLVERDLFLLENQLPYQLLKLLNSDEMKLKISMYAFCDLQNMFTVIESRKGLLYKDPKLLIQIVKTSSSPTHLLDYLRTNILSTGMESTHKDEPKNSSQPTLTLDIGLCTSVSQIFVRDLPKSQKMVTFMRKQLHEKKRKKASSLPISERETERGKQSSPSPTLEHQTERSKNQRLSWRLAAFTAAAQERYIAENFTSYRSIQELKAAAIKIKRKKNISPKNITFSSSFFCGKLNLPPLILNDTTVPILLNLAAYEACPDFSNKFEISSYIKLLDLLIDQPEDVKELRSSGILLNSLGCDEDVVKLFNTISSGLVHNPNLYSGIKDKMEKQYKNTFRVMAWTYYTYFRAPWSIIAPLAAVSALVLTALQTWKAF